MYTVPEAGSKSVDTQSSQSSRDGIGKYSNTYFYLYKFVKMVLGPSQYLYCTYLYVKSCLFINTEPKGASHSFGTWKMSQQVSTQQLYVPSGTVILNITHTHTECSNVTCKAKKKKLDQMRTIYCFYLHHVPALFLALCKLYFHSFSPAVVTTAGSTHP